jgi:hypothetical protein
MSAFGGKNGHGVCRLGLEGMVSKKLSASSRSRPADIMDQGKTGRQRRLLTLLTGRSDARFAC